jgi:hypothetical protein
MNSFVILCDLRGLCLRQLKFHPTLYPPYLISPRSTSGVH